MNDNLFRWNGAVGYRYVPPTGLYHAGAREYDPTVGRWLQRDPIGMAGGHPNLYVYCANNPVEAADPAGLRAATPAPSWAGLWTTHTPGYDMEDVAELVSKITPRSRDWFDNLTDFFAGMGDTISFGGTKIGRGLLGVEVVVDAGSGWYTGGQIAGTGVAVGIGGLGGLKAVGYKGKLAVHVKPHPFPLVGRQPHFHTIIHKPKVSGADWHFRVPLPRWLAGMLKGWKLPLF